MNNYPPFQNKYYKWYTSICESRQELGRKKIKGDGLTNHHIIPDSFYVNRTRNKHVSNGWLEGDPNEKYNLVLLTEKEHFLCHWLLTKCYTGLAKAKMVDAFRRTINGNRCSRYYVRAKSLYIKNRTGTNNIRRKPKIGIHKNCKFCNNEFYCSPSMMDRIYCSARCRYNDESNKEHAKGDDRSDKQKAAAQLRSGQAKLKPIRLGTGKDIGRICQNPVCDKIYRSYQKHQKYCSSSCAAIVRENSKREGS